MMMGQANGAAAHEPEIAITLAQSQWQTMLAILVKQPYEISAPLIAEIQQQAQASLAGLSQTIPTHTLSKDA